MNKKRIIITLLGVIVLIFLIYKIGLSSLIETLKIFKFNYLLLIILVLLADYILSGINIWIISRPFRKISLLNSIKYTFFTLFFAVILPGKLADLLLIPFLKREKLNTSQSTIVIFFDKIISLLVKVIFCLIGAIFILKKFNFVFIGIPLITLGLILLSLILINSKRIRDLIKKYILKKYSIIWKGFSRNLKNYQKKYKIYLIYDLLITLVKNFIEALLFFLLFLSFGQHTNLIEIFFVFNLLSIIILLASPVGISGLGIRELIGVSTFGIIGVNAAVVFNSFILRIALIYIINLTTFIIYHEDLNLLKKSKIWKKIKF